MTQKDKYDKVMQVMKNRGFVKKINVENLRSCIMETMTIKEGYMFSFHIKNMETLGLIKQTEYVGVFEILGEE